MPNRLRAGFSLLEVLVSMTVFAVLLIVVTMMVSRTGSIWSYTRGKIEQFRESRNCFDSLTRRLGESRLDTYLDYENSSGEPRISSNSLSFVPATYSRQSELRFISGPDIQGTSHAVFFQAPLGRTQNGNLGTEAINTVGYYIEFNNDTAFVPDFIPTRKRFRLMEMVEPTEKLRVYDYTSGTATATQRLSRNWFTDVLAETTPPVQIAGENIIALILLPMLPVGERSAGGYTEGSLAPNYLYDSTLRNSNPQLNPRNQLPPLIRVTMIAIDEASAQRLGDAGMGEMQTFLSTRFKTAANYTGDLKETEAWLTDHSINYRVFTSTINLRNAKWSREQKR